MIEAMKSDSGVTLTSLKVDGGASKNELLMQFQSDLLNVPLQRPVVNETTALGSAYAAGLGIGFYKDLDEIKGSWKAEKIWQPSMASDKRDHLVCFSSPCSCTNSFPRRPPTGPRPLKDL